MRWQSRQRHLRFYYGKHEEYIGSVSRKTKKAILGRRWNKSKLRKRLAAVVITERHYPEEPEISDVFCPKCGCEATKSTGNMACYPERWVIIRCLRCNFKVGTSDNGPYVHALEFKDNNYKIDI